MMNWSALTKKQQQMVVITAVLAVVQIVLLAHFLGWARSSESDSVKEDLNNLQQKLDDAERVVAREASVRADLKAGIKRLEELKVYTPNPSDRYAWAYEYVSRRAAQAGIEIDSLEESAVFKTDKNTSGSSYDIRVSTQCGFTELTDFLWRLETDNPLLRIKEVTVTLIPDEPLRQQVKIVIQWPSAITVERGEG